MPRRRTGQQRGSTEHVYLATDPEAWAGRFRRIPDLERFELGLAARLARHATPSAALTVLDLGCGAGRMAALFPSDAYVGVDIAPRLVRRAARNTAGRASFAVADMAQLPFRPGSFDLIVLMGTLESERDPAARIASLAPLLRADGGILLTLQNKRNLPARLGNLFASRYRQTFWSRKEVQAPFSRSWGRVEMASVFVLPPGVATMLAAATGMAPPLRRWLERLALRLEHLNTERDCGLGYEWQIMLSGRAET